MEYTTWIDGLPTVLVDIKPRSLIINLTGHSIHFSQAADEESTGGSTSTKSEPEYELPSCSVFTPSKITVQKFKFDLLF